MKIRKFFSISLLSLILAHPVNATLITLTDTGSTFDLTYDDALVGLFGAPNLTNNNITFNLTDFTAEATGPNQTDITASTVELWLDIKDGQQFSQIGLVERGDYKLNSVNSASVDVGGSFSVFDIANQISTEVIQSISKTSGAYINDNEFHNWEASVGVDSTNSDWYKGKTIKLTIENILTAQAQGFPDLAFIQKKLINGAIEVMTVPLPSAFILFSAGLLYLFPSAFRKR